MSVARSIASAVAKPVASRLSISDQGDVIGMLSNVEVALSFRKLSGSYSGNIVTLRRASDSASESFGLSSGNLDIASVESWASGASAFISTWFDQSGNSNNGVQAVIAEQPKLVESGSVVVKSGSVVNAQYDGINDAIDITDDSFVDLNGMSAFVVCKHDSGTVDDIALSLSGPTGNKRFYLGNISSSTFYLGYGDSGAKISGGSADSSYHLHTAVCGASTAEYFIDGVSKGTTASVDSVADILASIGSYNGTQGFWAGTIAEVIICSSDNTAARASVEANIKDYYGIS